MGKQFLIYLILLAAGLPAWSKQTEYYTMVSDRIVSRECGMEGNQIVNGKLIGSNCRPFTAKYCPWGVGNRNNCIIPCVHGAGPYRNPTRVRIRPVVCPWGPLKGKTITSVIIADSGPQHVDVFVGLCAKKKRGTDVCERYAPEFTTASYGNGVGRELQVAAALVNQYAPGAGTTMLAAARSGPAPATQITGSSGAPPRPSRVASPAAPSRTRSAPARPVRTAEAPFSAGFLEMPASVR